MAYTNISGWNSLQGFNDARAAAQAAERAAVQEAAQAFAQAASQSKRKKQRELVNLQLVEIIQQRKAENLPKLDKEALRRAGMEMGLIATDADIVSDEVYNYQEKVYRPPLSPEEEAAARAAIPSFMSRLSKSVTNPFAKKAREAAQVQQPQAQPEIHKSNPFAENKDYSKAWNDIPSHLKTSLSALAPQKARAVKYMGYEVRYTDLPQWFRTALEDSIPQVAENFRREATEAGIITPADTEIEPPVFKRDDYVKPPMMPPAPEIDKDTLNLIIIAGVGISGAILITMLASKKK